MSSSGRTQLISPSSPATLALTLRRRAMGAARGGGLLGTWRERGGTTDKRESHITNLKRIQVKYIYIIIPFALWKSNELHIFLVILVKFIPLNLIF